MGLFVGTRGLEFEGCEREGKSRAGPGRPREGKEDEGGLHLEEDTYLLARLGVTYLLEMETKWKM